MEEIINNISVILEKNMNVICFTTFLREYFLDCFSFMNSAKELNEMFEESLCGEVWLRLGFDSINEIYYRKLE